MILRKHTRMVYFLVQRYIPIKISPIVLKGKNMAYFNDRLMVAVLRWTARILCLALVAPGICNVVWAIQHGDLNPFTTSIHDNIIVVAMWTMTLGLLVGWKWEGIGGLLTLGGLSASFIMDQNNWPKVVDLALLVTGLFYLLCWWRAKLFVAVQMEWPVIKVLKRFQIPLILVAAHAVLVALIAASIATSSDPEAGMVWIAFNDFDYPLSQCIDFLPHFFMSNALVPWTFLTVGTIQWGIVGLVLQGVICFFCRIWKRSIQKKKGGKSN